MDSKKLAKELLEEVGKDVDVVFDEEDIEELAEYIEKHKEWFEKDKEGRE